MNKKFSTLVASVLLAGGICSSAYAIQFNKAVEGQYYIVNVNTASTVTPGNGNLVAPNVNSNGYISENSDAAMWAVKKVTKTVNGVPQLVGYQLVNKVTGKLFSFTDTDKTVYDTFTTSGKQLKFANSKKGWSNTVTDAANAWYYDLEEVTPKAATAYQLDDILGNGFGLQICKQVIKKDGFIDLTKAPVEYTDLKGNVFTGILYAEDGTEGVKLFQGKDGKQIVLTNETWGSQAGGTTQEGYKFAAVTAAELAKLQEKEAVLAEEFEIVQPATVAGEPLEVAVKIEAERYELVVTVIEDVARLTVAKSTTDNKADFTYTQGVVPVQNTYVKFGLSNVADPALVLTKNTFYTITEVAADGEFVLAANSCGKTKANFVEAAGNELEAQWAISYDADKNQYVIANREDATIKYEVAEGAVREDENTEDNVYIVGDKTIRIDAVETAENDGYMWLGDVENQHFAMAHWSGVYNDKAWFTADSKGNVVLTTGDVKEVAAELVATVKDTVLCISSYNYFDKKWVAVKDTLKVPVYSFVDMEGAAFTAKSHMNYVFDAAKKAKAQVLAIRENDGKYNLRLADVGKEADKNDGTFQNLLIDAGDSKNGLLENKSCIYDTNDGQLFVVEQMNRPIYRRLGATVEDNLKDMDVNTVKFHRANDVNQFLYENTHNRNAASNGEFVLNFLGETNLADKPEKAELAIFVDTAYVRNNTMEPLYLLSVRNKFVEGKDAEPCNATDHQHMTADGKPTNDPNECFHAKKATPDYREGAYLVNLTDSVANVKEAKYQGNTRFAFVDAKHIGDSLIINNSEFTATKLAANDTLSFVNAKGEQFENAATFSFRLVDPASEEGDFYIETVMDNGQHQYVRIHNTVPVLVSDLALAAKFNVNETTENATSNEEVAVSEVSVVAVDGAVVVKGAAGKTVAISNILGQTIANTVIASDNETIAVPAGIVVVAVEGEEAVKAIVR